MKRLLLMSTVILAVAVYSLGYLIEFALTVIGMTFDLPGLYTDGPFAWVWFTISVMTVVGFSFVFCRWLIRKTESLSKQENIFD